MLSKKIKSSPWVSILFSPKATIRRIVDDYPNRGFWILAWISGYFFLSNVAEIFNWGLKLPLYVIWLLLIILSPFVGYLTLSIGAWIVTGTGSWIGAKGKFQNVRSSFAWAHIPLIGYILIDLVLFILFGKELYSIIPKDHSFTTTDISILYVSAVVEILFLVWAIVLFIHTLAEVRKATMGKTLLNLAIAFVIYWLVVFLITLPFSSRCSPFFDEPSLTDNYHRTYQETYL